ncbi:ABC transporter ATP-binding protein [Sporosarcina pasteurii]|uniref:Lipopolysaccharide export system ATP-binding protein LptB n=1 Tax=Sporosarcina pasteurii TaxID=1474 RepID=A0A380C9J7_SPOPA|nr:ABC transporter ATP-binding protein [Sporosarcina pasteurii]MDS9472665.1 ABC transporter ATP-binding protein [Sporosarcina pasteurii]QBQ04325.1 ABC transporter ATP-binding protein [Sporosarcina pasteurii]SUJ15953.1 Lipopolysaccharide export system ATP-binding protein LptB [Sporosarcina pasteurii]
MSLQLENVTKRFGNFTAVDNLTLSVEQGIMYGFLGANGAGKTTTFRMILGLLNANEGRITWNDSAISYATSPEIGYLPEERGLYPKMKVEDQLIFLGQLRGMKKADAKAALKQWLERMEIPHYANKKVEELSKGNQQKIQVIASLIHQPRLLILDEPFSGLDPVNVEMLKNAILEFRNNGATIIFSSHRMDHVEELCEQLSIIHHGKQVVNGSLREVKRSFGKQNVRIHSEHDLSSLANIAGVTSIQKSIEGAVFQVETEEVAHALLEAALRFGAIRHFAIEEPSLQDIFIEKVGNVHA